MDAHRGVQSLIRMSLLRCLLLLTLSSAICLAQYEIDIQLLRHCGISGREQSIDLECTNITDFSSVSSTLTSAGEKVATLRISYSPQLVLQRTDLDSPAFNEITLLLWTRSEMTSFDPKPLQGLDKLEKLSLLGNNLHSIPADTFTGLTNLKELILEESNITFIEAGAFKVLRNLVLLDLSYNLLTSIPSGLFEGTTVHGLVLNGNQLTSIEEGSLIGLDNLLNINLVGNKIKTIDSKAFQTLVHLQQVDLERNQLEGIDSRLFENNPLIGLNFRKNNLENITNFHLNHTSLKTLCLGYCNIQSLPVDFFNNLPSLLILEVSGNNITTIPPGLFTPLTNLRFLELNNNKLTSLSAASFSELQNLVKAKANRESFTFYGHQLPSTILMKRNPWDCFSSDMNEIRAWCEQNNIVLHDLFNCH